jgi:hypothetical protein
MKKYEGVSKSSRTGRLERELQVVQLSASKCNCIAIWWVSLVIFAAITLRIASQRVFIVVSLYFVFESVRKLLDTLSYIDQLCPRQRKDSVSTLSWLPFIETSWKLRDIICIYTGIQEPPYDISLRHCVDNRQQGRLLRATTSAARRSWSLVHIQKQWRDGQ